MRLQHLNIDASQVTSVALLPGDPDRVWVIGQQLSGFRLLGRRREFVVGRGAYQGVPVTVCSTGIGCPSTAIAAEDLIAAGVRTLIRVGTCGGAWRSDVPCGSLVIPTAAVRDEGTTSEYIPAGFPAVADVDVVQQLRGAARALGIRTFVGINRTHDAFFGSRSSIMRWGEYLNTERWRGVDTPILSSEMECAALFVLASLRGVRAGAVLAVNAEPEPLLDRLVGKALRVASERNPAETAAIVECAISVALRAVAILAERDR